MANPTQFKWVDPVTNTDGSAIVAGEITGYNLGIRIGSLSPAVGTPGVYTINVAVAGATAASELLSAISPILAPNSYVAAIETVGPVDSAFSSEVAFVIAPPTPSAPTGLTIQ
jgi:hypothetical protein